MRVIECSGNPRQIGQATGEALRDEIAEHIELFPMRAWEEFTTRLPGFLATLTRLAPDVLLEMRATARGAGVDECEILRLNLPLFASNLDLPETDLSSRDLGAAADVAPDTSGCTNFVCNTGPDGPIWGKNNDGCEPHRPIVARFIRPDGGIPQLTFTFAGLVATTDGMNAEGVTVGHSSVGSVFQQSDHHVPIRLRAYDVLSRVRTTAEFVREMTAIPLRGKGYGIVCIDAAGAAIGIDAACPLLQLRAPTPAAAGLHAVNCYQHPALLHADRRPPEGKLDAHQRWHFLDQALHAGDGPPAAVDVSSGCGGAVPRPGAAGTDLAFARKLLHHHGDVVSLCRHGAPLGYHSEYSMIGLPASRRLLFCGMHPCLQQYQELVVQ
jgi:hypothetical protein